MPLAPGTRLGAYEIVGLIGAGGMGEVYKARDGRLDRTVAVKILSSRVASDPGLKQRFEREAKTLATLSHPHICSVFDVGRATTDQGPIDFLVIEHLEGETLAARLARGPLPSSDALRYAVEIAVALDTAHRKGVTHRDLKPGNVMLTTAGVKLLDFGLAKMAPTVAAHSDVTAAPTIDSPLTGAGSIVGTFQYMSPEQLEGQEADARSDIFAFGAVLYEMLTGRKAFEGKSQASLIGAILEREPSPVSSLQPASPPSLDQIVKTCLAKSPNDRWQSAADIGRQLEWILDASATSTASIGSPAVRLPVRRAWLWPAVIAAAVAVVAVGVAIWALTRSTPTAPATVSRLLLAPAATAPLVSVGGYDVAISPDGTKIVYLGEAPQGGRALYLRELGGLEPQMIRGTELPEDFGNANPFFSWDGASIGFRSVGKGILRVALAGGPSIKIADDEPGFVGAAWGPDDTLIMAVARGGMAGKGNGLYRTSAGGGAALERVAGTDAPNVFYAAPSMLPGGRAALFYTIEAQAQRETIGVLDLETRKEKTLVEGGANPMYAPSGHLVFARGTTLMAASFDLDRLEMRGMPVAVLPGVRHPGLITAADYGISRNGTLIYVPGPQSIEAGGQVTPVWVDRSGREIGPALNVSVQGPRSPRLSRDGKRLLLVTGPPADGDISIFDLSGRPPLPLVNRGDNLSPIWSRDEARVMFTSSRDGVWRVYAIPSDGSALQPQPIPIELGNDERFIVFARPPLTWTPDGRLIIAFVRESGGGSDLLALPAEGGRVDELVRTEFNEDSARVSPDGRWLAYRSNRSGRSEIWVRAIAGSAPARVSQDGGREPVWSRNGRELFYLQSNKVIAIAVKPGESFSFGSPVLLFDRPYFHGFGGGPAGEDVDSTYDVAPDGRFLMLPESTDPNRGAVPATGIVVVQNWVEELKQRVPVR
ncbi:MAG TPA: protein kinase [Vicinamibacterales bacterium]|nr:protein kinase [Vicinamibacterales bacterium]